MARSVDSRKVREWKRRMARFQEAEQSVAQFCRKEGVSAPSFYQWRKRLTRRSGQGKGKAAEATARFTPVRLVRSAGVAVRLPGGTRLHVPTDPETLRLVIDTLARADARHAGDGPC